MASEWLKQLAAEAAGKPPAAPQEKSQTVAQPQQAQRKTSQWLQNLAAAEVRSSPYYKYAILTQADDFAEKSKYTSTANGYTPSALAVAFGMTDFDESRSGWDDPLYEHINGNTDATNWLRNHAAAVYGGGLSGVFGVKTESKQEAKQMAKDEIAIYNYIHATQGKEAAREYYDYIRSDLYARDRVDAETYWAEEAKKDPVGTSVFSAVTSPLKVFSYLGQLADVMSGKEIDPNNPYNSFVYENNAIRNQVANDIKKNWGDVGSFSYQIGMSLVDSLIARGLAGGSGVVASMITGSGLAASETIDAIERGVDSDKAFLQGTIIGVIEGAAEQWSVGNLLNPELLADGSVKYILKNMLAEGEEEAATEFANTLVDIFISQDKSRWNLDIQAYMKQGLTEQEAFAKAVADKAVDIGLSALGGAISGGVMAGTGAGLHSIIQKSQGITAGNSTGVQDTIVGQTDTQVQGNSNGLQQAIQQAQGAAQGGENLQQADNTAAPSNSFTVTTPGVGQTVQIGVKEQIRSQQDKLNAMQPLYAIQVPTQFIQMDKAGKQEWVVEKLRSTGYKVDRKGFGIIDFAKKRLKAAFKYFDSGSADEAAFEALPYVLENGIEISSHSDHKGRNYRTVTFAAPVTINGKRGNMAVVVKQTTDNFYKVHRILTPDGSVFQLSETTNEAARADGGVTEIGSLATSNGAASSNSIHNRNQDVNTGREDGQSLAQRMRQNENVNGGNEYVKAGEQGQGTVAADAGAGDRISDGSGQRNDGAGAGEQAGGLGSRTGQAAQRQSSAADRKARVDRLNRIRSLQLEKVSSADLGVKRGTDGKNLQLIPEEHWDSEMEELAERIWQETGKTASFVMGVIEVQGSNGRIRKANGVMTGDRILVRVDHLRLTMEQIADHESYHGRVDYFKQRLNQEIRQHIIDTFSEKEFRKVLNKYFDAYEGVYDFGKAQTGEEFERLMQKLEEEVFADAYAGINSFGAGQFTEAVNERLEQLGTGRYRGQAQENGVRQTVGPPDEKFSINEDFAHEVDRWINEGMQTGEQFELGTTGDILQGLGAIESDIYMLGDKIQTIMDTHPEITKEEIKKIPQIVEDPILILKSRGVGRGDRGNTRLVIFGSVKAQNGQPVLTVLDLRPVESNLVIDDMQKVSSAYTKSSNPTGFIFQSDVLYADEKRTAKLLRTIGFQMPIELQQSGYIGSISYVGQNVNINGIPFSEIVKENSENEILIDEEFREKYGLKLPSLEDNTEESYSLDPEDVDRVDAELESEQQRWKEMWLQEQLGEEGVKEYQARKAEQEAQKKEDKKQVQQVKQKIDTNKRSLKREAAESAANARQSRRLALETKPKEAKKELRKAMLDMFSIPAGQRTEAVAVIDSFADRLLRQGSLTEEDRKAFFDRMYAAGMMTVPADDYLKLGRDAIYKGKIFVNESIRQELGDDWNELRRRAFSAGVYLTNNRADPGVDVWNDDLAQVLPGLFDSEETDLRLALERIIQVAEEGRDERVSLPEYTAMLAEEEYISEDQVLDQMERDMDLALRVFAKSAGLEIKLREQAIKEQAALTKENARQRFQQAQERAERKEMAQRQKEQKDLRELQQKTLKALQWLNRNRHKAPEDIRQTWDEVLSDIDIYAVGAANEMNWSNKYGATWKDLAQMYSYAKENDPNFMPSKDLEKIVSRLSDKKIEDMDPAALSDLYRMAVGLRTEFYNRNNVAGDEERRLFSEVYTDAKQEIKAAPGKYNGKWMDKLFNLDQLTPMNVLQRMAGWNPESTFYSMAQQLERGERDMRAFSVKAQRLLQDFLTEHESWVKKADGQGKDAIWYELEVPELMELGMGDKPIFGDTVKVYMTPAQKVHMYLESKNVDNLRHMTGGRTFADKELYSNGKRKEAFAQGRTIRMAPETVKQIVSDLTAEEMELAEVLDKFYNDFAKGEINRVSNILYGYDKAMGRHYAPIFTNQNYVQSEIGIFDQTAEGVGNLKAREYSKNPSYNIGAFDAFERNVDQTARFVGMAIPARNWNSLLNWREKNDSMGDVITHKWGNEGKNYITDLIATLQGGEDAKTETVSSGLSKLQSNYISAVFGANPGIVLKQLGSIPLAGAYLGNGNMPTPAQIKGIDRNLIAKYTQDLEWRTMGYSTPETKQLKDNPNWTQTNKAFKFAFGGGAITAMDGWAASTLWPWAENKVRREHPDLELGTQDQIDKGESLFYKKVAEEFEYAMSRSQSASDEIHQSSLRKSGNVLAKAFTMFRSDSAQTYNTLRQKIGEARYYASTGADEKATQAAKKAVGSAVLALVVNAAWAEGVSFLMALWKNGAKYYRDDEDELTAEAVVGEMVSNMLTSVSGTVVFGDELTGLIGNILTGEKWYGIDAPGLGQLSDLCETIYKAGGGMRDIIEGAVDVLKNGGDVGQYFQDNSSEIQGSILELAEAAAMYIPGLPVSNVEAYLLGTLKWLSPALHTEYEDMLETAKKGGLSGLEGDALTTRVGNILENRRVTNDAETAKILAGLYEAGYKAAVPSDTPSSVTVGGENHDLSAYQQQVYNNAWAGIVGEELDVVVSSEEFLNASEEKQEKMLKTLYGYASDQAKAEVFDELEGSSRAEDIAAFRRAGLDMADYLGAVADGIDPDKFLETFGNGLDSDDTEELLNAIEDLEPEEGKVQVTDVQRWRVCVDLYGNPQFQLAALMTYMTDSQFAKAKTAHTFDVDLDAYVKLYEIRTKHDANGNKSYSQAEYKAAIDTLNVSNDDRAVLWQLATGAKSAKNNPYSSAVGQRVLDAMG